MFHFYFIIKFSVLRQFPTMKRLFGTLSQCSTNTFTMMSSSCFFSLKTNMVLDEPQTIADAVFSLMITLSERASNPRLVVAPICQYLEESKKSFNTFDCFHIINLVCLQPPYNVMRPCHAYSYRSPSFGTYPKCLK